MVISEYERERREFEEELEYERQNHAEMLEEERKRHTEQLEIDRQIHAEELANKHELKIRESQAVCYDATGNKILGKYEGEFKSNTIPDGRGVLICDDGDIYEGEFSYGRFNGYGKSIRNDGSVRYEGLWKMGVFHGEGTYYYRPNEKQGRASYAGSFVDGKRSGRGVLSWVDGTIYDGEFIDGEMSGSGVMKWANGDIYEGQFSRGMRNGYGKYTTAIGSSYEGLWSNGLREGKGVVTYPDLKCYECEWKADKVYDGILQNRCADGKTVKFDGVYKNGLYHGQGTLYYNNGTIEYKGKWVAGERSGKGTSYYQNGNVRYEGEWLHNMYAQSGVEYDENGEVIREGTFKDGKVVDGVCAEGNVKCFGTFDDCQRFVEGRIYLNDELTLFGNINADKLEIFREGKYLPAVRIMDKNAFIGTDGNQYYLISWESLKPNETESIIGIRNVCLQTGTLVNGFAVTSLGETEECFYKDGNAILTIDVKTKQGELVYKWKRISGVLFKYQLPKFNGEDMVLSGKFVDCKPTGLCTLKNHTDVKKVTYVEKATYVNGLRDGEFFGEYSEATWVKNKLRGYTSVVEFRGKYKGGEIDNSYAEIKFVIPQKKEWRGPILHLRPHGMGVMTHPNSVISYGMWENGVLKKELNPLVFKFKQWRNGKKK